MHNILLVEDNEMNRDMLSRRLIKRGYKIEIAINGQEVLTAETATGTDSEDPGKKEESLQKTVTDAQQKQTGQYHGYGWNYGDDPVDVKIGGEPVN